MILPVGTHVVTRAALPATSDRSGVPAGAVGVIVKAPADASHAYRVRFVDGTEAAMLRAEFSIRKQEREAGLHQAAAALDEWQLNECVILRCVVGSRAYGLDDSESDIDRRGVYLPPADLHWSLYGVPEQLENTETDECYWELQKFLVLALKANPNVLECLYTPIVEYATPLARELLDMRAAFLSRLVYQTYNGYVMSQFKKLGQDLRAKGAIKWKHAMHLIRLLLSGITVLREGFVPVRVEEHRAALLAIKSGETPWDEINQWRLRLHLEFDAVLAVTKLPDRPECERVNRFLIKARRAQV